MIQHRQITIEGARNGYILFREEDPCEGNGSGTYDLLVFEKLEDALQCAAVWFCEDIYIYTGRPFSQDGEKKNDDGK